jgi:threonine dehydratase
MTTDPSPVTPQDVRQARERIGDAIYTSPCPKSETLSNRFDANVRLKLENLQRTGSFKERGARNKLMTLSQTDRDRGVIAASAGNHAQAVAYHGTELGIDSKIVMPEGTPLVKVTRTRRYGADVVLTGSNYDEAYAAAREIGEDEDRSFIHPFDDRAVIAGQGTISLELLDQQIDPDVVIIAVGGGGLISGMGVALKDRLPDVRIVGVEPESLPSMRRALDHGGPTEVPAGQTLADGIAVRQVGELTHATAKTCVDEMVTVSEEEIANAILTMLEEEKSVAEGAGAAPIAAMMNGSIDDLDGQTVVPVICGGNIDVNVISRIIDRGLAAAGRLYRLDLQIRDVPGSLAELLGFIGEMDANVLEIYHDRTFTEDNQVGMTNVELKLETRGSDHIERLRDRLEEEGYQILDHL